MFSTAKIRIFFYSADFYELGFKDFAKRETTAFFLFNGFFFVNGELCELNELLLVIILGELLELGGSPTPQANNLQDLFATLY